MWWRRRGPSEAEFRQEVEAHLAIEVERLLGEGLSQQEAERQARVTFGNVAAGLERHRTSRRAAWLDSLTRDTRYAVRTLGRSRGFAGTAVLVLGLAMAACTAVFSVVQAVLLRPLGIDAPDRVVVFWPEYQGTTGEYPFNATRDFLSRMDSFEGVALMGSVNWPATMAIGEGAAFGVSGNAVSAGFFEALRARPLIGRTFRPEDDEAAAPRVLVLSHATWIRHFGADLGIVGRSIRVNSGGENAAEEPFEIVGVMPPAFFFPRGAEYWTPAGRSIAEFARNLDQTPDELLDGLNVFYGVARLGDGFSDSDARMEHDLRVREFAAKHKIDTDHLTLVTTPLVEHVFGPARTVLVVLMGAVGAVLLVACTNVAGLLLVRGAARRRALSVRAALGATRGALIQQLTVESAILVAVATTLGIVLAAISVRLIVALLPMDVPRLSDVAIDHRVLLFSLVVAGLATVLMGVMPARQVSRVSVLDELRTHGIGNGRQPRLGGALVGFQVAAATALLTAAALCVQSFARVSRLDLGFNPTNVLTFGMTRLDARYTTLEARVHAVEGILARLEQLPGVIAAGAVYQRPFEHGPIGLDMAVVLEEQANSPPSWTRNPLLNLEPATPSYFETMRIPLLRGRSFEATDQDGSPLVVIVSEATAARLWPGQDPIGKRLRSYSPQDDPDRSPYWHTVVGVVGTARYREIQAPRLDVYVPLRQVPQVQHFVVRTSGDPLDVLPGVTAAVASFDEGLTVGGATTMERIVRRVRGPWELSAMVFSLFSAAALGLAVLGLFGLVAHTVQQRRREIGVRIALGAAPPSVVRLMLARGVRPALTGLAAGLAVTYLTSHVLSSLLFQVQPTDPATFVAIPAALVLATLAASYAPARRAALVDPIVVLRDE
jgi:putative ABC transport system permease protein